MIYSRNRSISIIFNLTVETTKALLKGDDVLTALASAINESFGFVPTFINTTEAGLTFATTENILISRTELDITTATQTMEGDVTSPLVDTSVGSTQVTDEEKVETSRTTEQGTSAHTKPSSGTAAV